jgi:type II secretory pathway component PulK
VGELLLVQGMTPERYAKLRPWVTVYSKRVNINTAPRQTLLALGMSASLADKVIAYRRGPDGLEGTSDDGVFTSVSSLSQNLDLTPDESSQLAAAAPLLDVSSRAFRMHLAVWPGDRPIEGRAPASYDIVLEFRKHGQWTIKHFSRA